MNRYNVIDNCTKTPKKCRLFVKNNCYEFTYLGMYNNNIFKF